MQQVFLDVEILTINERSNYNKRCGVLQVPRCGVLQQVLGLSREWNLNQHRNENKSKVLSMGLCLGLFRLPAT